MKFWSSFFFWMCACALLFAQDAPNLVVAESGDGIFSILRKQGLDPAKYYEEFLILNEGKIKNGSYLQVGVSYQIPEAADSFKNTGVQVLMDNKVEAPIFEKELGNMSLQSEKLKDAVYYLVLDGNADKRNDFLPDITHSLAADLMVHGAKVYVLGNEPPQVLQDSVAKMSQTQRMGVFVSAINKRYIQNMGKYQRVLVIRTHGVTGEGNLNIAVYHYTNSADGQRLAENIQSVFKKNSVSNRSSADINMLFEDSSSLYLAKNVLPAISMLTLENTASKAEREHIAVRPDKKLLTNLLTNGIMNDFADLEIED